MHCEFKAISSVGGLGIFFDSLLTIMRSAQPISITAKNCSWNHNSEHITDLIVYPKSSIPPMHPQNQQDIYIGMLKLEVAVFLGAKCRRFHRRTGRGGGFLEVDFSAFHCFFALLSIVFIYKSWLICSSRKAHATTVPHIYVRMGVVLPEKRVGNETKR